MRIVFMGTPLAAAASLARLLDDGHEVVAVYTQPDRPSGRGNKIVFSPVKELATERGLHILQPARIKTPETLSTFTGHAADVAVVVAYGRILPAGFLNAFPKGAINVHFSLLPRYRGAAPVNWAIVKGESSTGVTTIRMDEGLDTGDILLSRETQIGPEETAPELMARLADIGSNVLSETLAGLDTIKSVPQDHSAATFAPIMKREDGLINWALPAAEIKDRVRGFQPFPGSFTFLDGKRITVWKAAEAELTDPAAVGTISDIGSGRPVVVAGGNTALELIEIQFEGKRRIFAGDAVNSGQIRPAMQFEQLTNG